MKFFTCSLLQVFVLSTMIGSGCSSFTSESSINPGDTIAVPDYLTGEDSIAYIENTIIQSPITAEDLLSLAEVHSVEGWLGYYNNLDMAKEYPEYAERFLATAHDSASLRLANRFMRMADLVNQDGDAMDKLQWAIAVNAALDTFRAEMPALPSDSTLDEIERVTDKFSSQTQTEMNYQCRVSATVDYYRTIEAYRIWLESVPRDLSPLAKEEYIAWHDLNKARYSFWRDVSYTQGWYSMKPMETAFYYESLSRNRRAELELERGIIMNSKPYKQMGKTVTTAQWEKWITTHSVPEDADLLIELDDKDRLPSDSLVAERVGTLKATFSRWIAARQAIAAALSKEQGDAYDNLTADIHSRFIGTLPPLIPYEE